MNTATTERYAAPRVNIAEDANVFTIEAEMPGVAREGVEIEVVKGELVLIGKREGNGHGGALRMQERTAANFRRAFALGNSINVNHVEAKMADGVLTITLHKIEDVKPRKIAIN